MDTNRRTLNSYAKIKLWEDGPNYRKVVKYVNNSQCHPNIKLTVVNIHRVWVRNQDDENLFHISNRHLLWHGTKRSNIPNILNDGFKLPTNVGQMFGSGIYFADRITKSSNYSDLDVTFLLLCEVGLGKVYSCKRPHNDWLSPPSGFDSVKANGTYVPDWTEIGRYCGAQIPFGRTAKCTKYTSHAVNYNEFIVYDPSRIIIRFLVEVKVEQVTSPLSLQLITPGAPISKTAKKSVAASTTNKNGVKSTIKPTSLNPTFAATKTSGYTIGSNNLRSSNLAPAAKPKLSLPSSNVTPIQYSTTNTAAQNNNNSCSCIACTRKPTTVPLPSSNVATVNAIGRNDSLRSSYSTYATKPTPAPNAYPSYGPYYSGYTGYSSDTSSIPISRAQPPKKQSTCVIL